MAPLDSLLQHIEFRLVTRKFCILSERELSRVWPWDIQTPQERESVIREFAWKSKLSAAILASGKRVVFKRQRAPISQSRRFPARASSELPRAFSARLNSENPEFGRA